MLFFGTAVFSIPFLASSSCSHLSFRRLMSNILHRES